MAGIIRYTRKPTKTGGDIFVAKYVPGDGRSLADILALARVVDAGAQAREVCFASGPVLLVRYHDDDLDLDFVIVEAGGYLARSVTWGRLYANDDGDLRQFYEKAEVTA